MIRQLAVVHTECCCSCGTCQCAILHVQTAVSWRLEWEWFYICLQMIYSGNISHECCEIRTWHQFVHSLQKQRKAICRTGKTCVQNISEIMKLRSLIRLTVFRVLKLCSILDWEQSSSKMSVSVHKLKQCQNPKDYQLINTSNENMKTKDELN